MIQEEQLIRWSGKSDERCFKKGDGMEFRSSVHRRMVAGGSSRRVFPADPQL